MGYESRLYVVKKSHFIKGFDNRDKTYAEVIAMFDLSKVYAVSDRMRRYKDTDAYIYASDGNTEIIEDFYGEPLKEIPIKDAVKIIKEASNTDDYWRYEPCIALLEALANKSDELVVLHYGY